MHNSQGIDDQLIRLIDRLNEAVNVCHEASNNDNDNLSCHYATGYSQSAMSAVADKLSVIVKQMRDPDAALQDFINGL